jgi:hypothetical protein
MKNRGAVEGDSLEGVQHNPGLVSEKDHGTQRILTVYPPESSLTCGAWE